MRVPVFTGRQQRPRYSHQCFTRTIPFVCLGAQMERDPRSIESVLETLRECFEELRNRPLHKLLPPSMLAEIRGRPLTSELFPRLGLGEPHGLLPPAEQRRRE